MAKTTEPEPVSHTFWDFYQASIRPKLKEIDVLLRSVHDASEGGRLSITDTANALGLSAAEVCGIMAQKNIEEITVNAFLTIMTSGSSGICGFYRREIECGSPYTYTREAISYIYQLDIDTVNAVCDRLRIKEATAFTLPLLFAQINFSKG